jgi:hypothetical protein
MKNTKQMQVDLIEDIIKDVSNLHPHEIVPYLISKSTNLKIAINYDKNKVVNHSLTVLKCGYQFNGKDILFNDCDEMAKFIGFKNFKDLQDKEELPKDFEITINKK